MSGENEEYVTVRIRPGYPRIVMCLLVLGATLFAPAPGNGRPSDTQASIVSDDIVLAATSSACKRKFPNSAINRRSCDRIKLLPWRAVRALDHDKTIENTVAAFRFVRKEGASGAEIDVWPSRRGEKSAQGDLYLHHDSTLWDSIDPDSLEPYGIHPSTNPTNVSESIWPHLRTNGGQYVSSFEQSINWSCSRSPRFTLLTEIKYNFPREAEVVDQLKDAACGSSVWFYQAPNDALDCSVPGLSEMMEASDQAGITVRFGIKNPPPGAACYKDAQDLVGLGADLVTVRYAYATRSYIERMHQHGIGVVLSFTTEPAQWETAIRRGWGRNPRDGIIYPNYSDDQTPDPVAGWFGRQG